MKGDYLTDSFSVPTSLILHCPRNLLPGNQYEVYKNVLVDAVDAT